MEAAISWFDILDGVSFILSSGIMEAAISCFDIPAGVSLMSYEGIIIEPSPSPAKWRSHQKRDYFLPVFAWEVHMSASALAFGTE